MAQFDPEGNIPRHVAIIMDGNGRWAESRGLPRRDGHRAGAESVEQCLEACGEIGIEHLTLYAFSAENWKRPKPEVDALMGLMVHFLKEKTAKLVRSNVHLKVIGHIERLPTASRRELEKTIDRTRDNDGLRLTVALSYGSREEIVDAARRLMEKAARGEMSPGELDSDRFAEHLDTAGTPDPDLLIRTSGESRVSNFLLWQISYTEIHICEVLWPDFRREHLEESIAEYQRRQRRFGGL